MRIFNARVLHNNQPKDIGSILLKIKHSEYFIEGKFSLYETGKIYIQPEDVKSYQIINNFLDMPFYSSSKIEILFRFLAIIFDNYYDLSTMTLILEFKNGEKIGFLIDDTRTKSVRYLSEFLINGKFGQ